MDVARWTPTRSTTIFRTHCLRSCPNGRGSAVRWTSTHANRQVAWLVHPQRGDPVTGWHAVAVRLRYHSLSGSRGIATDPPRRSSAASPHALPSLARQRASPAGAACPLRRVPDTRIVRTTCTKGVGTSYHTFQFCAPVDETVVSSMTCVYCAGSLKKTNHYLPNFGAKHSVCDADGGAAREYRVAEFHSISVRATNYASISNGEGTLFIPYMI